MEKKQTAIQWLSERLIRMIPTINPIYKKDIDLYLEQALQMERTQIEEAFEKGVECGDDNGVSFIDIHAQQYYTITYSEPTKN